MSDKPSKRRGKKAGSRTITGYEYEAFLLFEKLENQRALIRHAILLSAKDGFVARVAALDKAYSEYVAARALLRAEWGLD